MSMIHRGRRLRASGAIRNLIRETKINIEDLVYPIFVVEGENIKKEISSLPNNYHLSVDNLDAEIKEMKSVGLESVLIFGLPGEKDAFGKEAYNDDGIVQKAVREIKAKHPDMLVITDICMCQYTDHGHCGILQECGCIDNDLTLEYLSKIAISHARAGADMVAPSDMMDGRVGHMRKALDSKGFEMVGIMSYSAKYSSSFYGPFRDAADSAPSFGDRKTYQMDPANSDEAMREIAMDLEEGADVIMVKPALSYLDIIRRAKDEFNAPLAAYSVSGEYAMLKNAIDMGIINESAMMEAMTSIKRAGADILITYFAKDIAKIIRKNY